MSGENVRTVYRAVHAYTLFMAHKTLESRDMGSFISSWIFAQIDIHEPTWFVSPKCQGLVKNSMR